MANLVGSMELAFFIITLRCVPLFSGHLPIKEQDRRFRAACSGSDGRTFSHGNAPGVGDDDFDDLDGVDDDFEDGFDY